ncbi:DUF4349 domain-containing protein, partial [Trebonia sp.]|uniref:DUF4349 domain-containing protein n=1 Tax=Trebonia sp. TaxID=2767075 RepID=UPI0026215685
MASSESAAGAPAPVPSAAPSADANLPAAGFGGGSAQSDSARLVPTGQQLIYTAQLTVRVRGVSAAIARATSIVTSAGGYVSSENATTNPSHP